MSNKDCIKRKSKSLQRRLLTCRQIAVMVLHHCKLTDADGAAMRVLFKGDTTRTVDTLWDKKSQYPRRIQSRTLESLHSRQLAKCAQMKDLVSLQTQDHVPEGEAKETKRRALRLTRATTRGDSSLMRETTKQVHRRSWPQKDMFKRRCLQLQARQCTEGQMKKSAKD